MKACVVYGSDIVLHLEFSVFVRPGSPRSLHSDYGIARPDRQQHPLGSCGINANAQRHAEDRHIHMAEPAQVRQQRHSTTEQPRLMKV